MEPTTAPWWGDYLTRERTLCALCHREGERVRIGDPIPPDYQRRGRKAAHRTTQRAAMKRHMAEVHPTVRVRWAR